MSAERPGSARARAAAALAVLLVPPAAIAAGSEARAEAGAPGGPGLALAARKVLTAVYNGESALDNAVVLVKEGRIEAVGSHDTTPIPEGYEVLDLGDLWLAPGMIDLHNHCGAPIDDLNDMVYLTNPELRASAAVTPNNSLQRRGVAGGVTTVLTIPGSGTNMGGQGVLLKTAGDSYEDIVVRNPGSLKLAQAGNPERWVINPGRSFMNWNSRNTFLRGLAYARRWAEYESRGGERPEKDLQFEVFRDLLAKDCQVSAHTQVYQVVLMTITMVRKELGLDVFIDHGEFEGMLLGALAQEAGVAAIIGPREIDTPVGRSRTDGKILSIAGGYQARGHTMVGFNTDCIGSFSLMQEDLSLHAAASVRYGFDNSRMDAVRGLTIVPAMVAGLGDEVGSIEAGKQADLIAVTGDPVDPRHAVEIVWIRGRRMYDTRSEARQW